MKYFNDDSFERAGLQNPIGINYTVQGGQATEVIIDKLITTMSKGVTSIHFKLFLNGIAMPEFDVTFTGRGPVLLTFKINGCSITFYFWNDPFFRVWRNNNPTPIWSRRSPRTRQPDAE